MESVRDETYSMKDTEYIVLCPINYMYYEMLHGIMIRRA